MKAIIEIPKGSKFKYEIKEGKLILDRPINQPCPFNYGYFPSTLELDGDPADCFVISEDPVYPTTEVEVELIGKFSCIDNGVKDDKFICHLQNEKYDVFDVLANVRNYLESYKEGFHVLGFYWYEEAMEDYKKTIVKK